MFGYVKVYKPELKIKDYESYKGVYCTLCKTLGKEYGITSRSLLSFDTTFYALFILAVTNDELTLCDSRCTFNPCKKCIKAKTESDVFKKAAGLTIILSYFKLLDNISDSQFFKKVLFSLLRPYFAIKVRKAKKRYPEMYELTQDAINKQDEAEKQNASVDMAADPTASLLRLLVSMDSDDEKIHRFAYMLGRVIYLLDAYDDYEKDIRKGCYNPFMDMDNLDELALISVNTSVGEMAKLLNEIKVYRFRDIIENIVLYGFEARLKQIKNKEGSGKNEQSL
ncbi:MAG: DUF5685 family protein [Clostridiales bacterium]|nr:DUF5685 family protein [Clostridiales bacterium]